MFMRLVPQPSSEKILKRGFEPDSCFYFRNAAHVRGKDRLDLAVDPPPELVVEIEITNSAIKKFPLFAKLGAPEVWRYDGEQVAIHSLQGARLIESRPASSASCRS